MAFRLVLLGLTAYGTVASASWLFVALATHQFHGRTGSIFVPLTLALATGTALIGRALFNDLLRLAKRPWTKAQKTPSLASATVAPDSDAHPDVEVDGQMRHWSVADPPVRRWRAFVLKGAGLIAGGIVLGIIIMIAAEESQPPPQPSIGATYAPTNDGTANCDDLALAKTSGTYDGRTVQWNGAIRNTGSYSASVVTVTLVITDLNQVTTGTDSFDVGRLDQGSSAPVSFNVPLAATPDQIVLHWDIRWIKVKGGLIASSSPCKSQATASS